MNKILDVSQRLFLEKGYGQTTIQDIVDELDGLTKGAVYHHFKSKEDILKAVSRRISLENNPYDRLKDAKSLTALEKIQQMIILPALDEVQMGINRVSVSFLKNPYFLAEILEDNQAELTPILKGLIEEGIRDGSIQANNPKLLAEMVTLLMNLWLHPSVYPSVREEYIEKIEMIGEAMEALGLPVLNGEVREVLENYYDALS